MVKITILLPLLDKENNIIVLIPCSYTKQGPGTSRLNNLNTSKIRLTKSVQIHI